jgi:hypothetical protein
MKGESYPQIMQMMKREGKGSGSIAPIPGN